MSNKIKILQITSDLHYGGAESMIVDIVENIDNSKYEVVICCINEKGVLGERLENNGYRVYEVRSEIKKQSYFLLAKRIKQIISNEIPDVVHSHCDSALIDIGPIYVLNKDLPPLVHTFHFGNYPHISKKYIYLQMLFARYATQLVAVGEVQREQVIRTMKINPITIKTVLNGVSKNPYLDDKYNYSRIRSELGLTENDVVVGCVAVLTEQKGIPEFLHACKRLINSFPRVKFLVVGGGPLLETLQKQAISMDIDNNVVFCGWRTDVQNILPIFDIYVIPSLWEAMSISLLEAMAARRPIVATNVGENALVIHDCESGIIVPPGDERSLADAIETLLSDKNTAELYAQRSYRDFEKKYSTLAMIDGYTDIYNQVI